MRLLTSSSSALAPLERLDDTRDEGVRRIRALGHVVISAMDLAGRVPPGSRRRAQQAVRAEWKRVRLPSRFAFAKGSAHGYQSIGLSACCLM